MGKSYWEYRLILLYQNIYHHERIEEIAKNKISVLSYFQKAHLLFMSWSKGEIRDN